MTFADVKPLAVLILISLIGGGTLFGVFKKMQRGFGPFNLRVVGIVLVATLAALLSVLYQDSINAAMGILGAIAGYLFGLKAERHTPNRTGQPVREADDRK
jgi:hypothetical protein